MDSRALAQLFWGMWEYSWTQAWTCDPCIGRWILIYWTTRKAPPLFIYISSINGHKPSCGLLFFHLEYILVNTPCQWTELAGPFFRVMPGKSHGRRSLVGCSSWSRNELDMTERLHFHFSLSCIGEGNGNPLQCFHLENQPGGLPSMGLHRVGHWSDLAAAAAFLYVWMKFMFSWMCSHGCSHNVGNTWCCFQHFATIKCCSVWWTSAFASSHIQVIVSEGEIPRNVITGLEAVCICHLGRYYHLFCIEFVPVSFFIIRIRECQFLQSLTNRRCYQTFWSLPIWWVKHCIVV